MRKCMISFVIISPNKNNDLELDENVGFDAIRTYLNEHNIESSLIYFTTGEIDAKGEKYLIDKILINTPVVIGMWVDYETINICRVIAEKIKEVNKQIHIVLGGAFVT